VLVVDADAEGARGDVEDAGIRGVVDFREAFVWDEGAQEGAEMRAIEEGLGKDDVINLQFTRSGLGAQF
jgi:hypothetical protein